MLHEERGRGKRRRGEERMRGGERMRGEDEGRGGKKERRKSSSNASASLKVVI